MTRAAWSVGLVVFVVSLARGMAEGIGLVDEAWFLQVVARLRAGDVLYRDVFFGSTPLAVYGTTAVTFVTGLDVIAVKLVTNGAFAATTVLAWLAARRAGISGASASALAAALLVFARPYTSAPYTPLAMTAFLAVILCAVPAAGETPGGSRRGFAAGLFTGLAFLAKPNVGLLAAAAAVAAIAAWRVPARERARTIAELAATAAGVSIAGLIPVWIEGGLPMLADYVFLNKGAYLALGRIPYTASLAGWIGSAATPWSPASLNELVRGAILIVPAALAVAAFAAWRRRALDAQTVGLLAFAAAATLVAHPRWNRFHLAYALPVLLLALAIVLERLVSSESPWVRRVRRLSPAALPAAVVAMLLPAALDVARGARPSGLPHFRGALLAPGAEAALATSARAFASASRGRPVFVVSPRAGFLYLAGDVANPTPYDIPSPTSVGLHGTSALQAAIANGGLPAACVGHDRAGLYYFAEIAAAVEAHLAPGPDVGLCRMYGTP